MQKKVQGFNPIFAQAFGTRHDNIQLSRKAAEAQRVHYRISCTIQSSSNSTRDVDTAECDKCPSSLRVRLDRQNNTALCYHTHLESLECGCKNYCYMI